MLILVLMLIVYAAWMMCVYILLGCSKNQSIVWVIFFSRVLFSCSMRCMRGVLAERKRDCL